MNFKQYSFLLASILACNAANAQMIFIIKQKDNSLLVMESQQANPGEIRVCTANVGQKLAPCIKTVPNSIERDEKGIKPYAGVAYKMYVGDGEK